MSEPAKWGTAVWDGFTWAGRGLREFVRGYPIVAACIVAFVAGCAAGRATAFHNTPTDAPSAIPNCNAGTPGPMQIGNGQVEDCRVTVDHLMLQQPPAYLKFWYERSIGGVPDFKVAKVNAISSDPKLPDLFYIAGQAAADTSKVQGRYDFTGVYVDAELQVGTASGLPRVWKFPVPKALQDSKPHKLVIRVYRGASTTPVFADNATSTAPYIFTLGPYEQPPPSSASSVTEIVVDGVRYLEGKNMPTGAVQLTVSINGSFGIPNGTVMFTNGTFRWRVPGYPGGSYAAMVSDASGKRLATFTGVLMK